MKVVGAALLVTAMCAQVYASEVAKADSAPAKADNLFVQADKNRDGKLDQTEFTLFKQLQEERLMRISVCPATCSGFIRPGVSV